MNYDPYPDPVEDVLRAEALDLRARELADEAQALAIDRPTSAEGLERLRQIEAESRFLATSARDMRRAQIERDLRERRRALERARRPSWKFWRRG